MEQLPEDREGKSFCYKHHTSGAWSGSAFMTRVMQYCRVVIAVDEYYFL
jgi:hypothetical protein